MSVLNTPDGQTDLEWSLAFAEFSTLRDTLGPKHRKTVAAKRRCQALL